MTSSRGPCCRCSTLLLLLIAAWLYPVCPTNCRRKYFSSPVEIRWLTNIGEWQSPERKWTVGCHAVLRDRAVWTAWLEGLAERNASAMPLNRSIFSYHTVQCNGEPERTLYLEPLAALLRHPLFFCTGNTNLLYDTSWLALPHVSEVAHQTAYFFDLGSTYYNAGVGGYRDSLAWFVDTYRKRGIEFSEIFAWEIKHVEPHVYWSRVPDLMKHRMHFFNVACTANETGNTNPLNMIRTRTSVEDYVVLKVDIDTNWLESRLILQVLNDELLISLIDELFWENHVVRHPLQWHGWGRHVKNSEIKTLEDSYKIFLRLRQAGVRAHSWV